MTGDAISGDQRRRCRHRPAAASPWLSGERYASIVVGRAELPTATPTPAAPVVAVRRPPPLTGMAGIVLVVATGAARLLGLA